MSKAILKKGLGLKVVALAAVVAAVALVGVVFTQSADAAGPGDTVNVPEEVTAANVTAFNTGDGIARFAIDEASTASGSFAANGGQSISCQDGATCDVDTDADQVQVKLNVDDDSPNGYIIVNISDLEGTIDDDRELITVNTDERVVAIEATTVTPNPAIPADGTGAAVTITTRLTNPSEGGVNGKAVVIFTTLGLLGRCGGADDVQACSENSATVDDGNADTTDDDGYVQVTLQATQRAGVATVTFTSGDLSDSVDVVFYGDADAITAEAMQSSISNVDDATFIVVTVTDSGGNPVVTGAAAADNYAPVGRSQGADNNDADLDGVVGPGPKSLPVTDNFNFDFIHPTDPDQSLPACGNDTGSRDNPATEAVEDDFDPLAADAGTNAAGQCVIMVSSTFSDDDNPANDTSRGTHTVHIAGPEADQSKDVSVAIQVGGAPSAISSDAPASVDPLSATEITVTVVDDEGVPVGEVVTSVNQIEGAGRVIAGDGEGMTSDGAVSFTYLAPQTPGTAVFRVTAGAGEGQIAASVVITIGTPEAEAPDAISLSLRAGGRFYAVTADGPTTTASALFGDAVTSAWKYNQDTGAWDVVYIPGRSANFSIDTGDVLYVTSPIDQTVGG